MKSEFELEVEELEKQIHLEKLTLNLITQS
ncbi:hypothetical protein SOV_09540 [Sporomusa ovata DSM 2662]|nr:hypothetical protein SOV_1c02920 [Sporomusa ovata DSM 2662]